MCDSANSKHKWDVESLWIEDEEVGKKHGWSKNEGEAAVHHHKNMHSTLLLLASLLPLMVSSSPLPSIQAGGPAIIPIPANCTVTYPLTHPNGYMPIVSSTNMVYEAYFLKSGEPSDVAQQCFEQCHGMYQCISAFLGYQIPTPEGYYGGPGGSLEIGCLMYKVFLTPDDFVPAPSGQYQNSSAANIFCP